MSFSYKDEITDGINVIEASAGTGKTYTIEHLVLRLLLEDIGGKVHTIDSILIVTFANAAAAEIKNRVRNLLIEAHKGRVDGESIEKVFPSLLKEEIEIRVEKALNSYDEASIYTLHSFSQRTLSDYAVETKMPLRAEVDNSGGATIEEIWNFFRLKSEEYDENTLKIFYEVLGGYSFEEKIAKIKECYEKYKNGYIFLPKRGQNAEMNGLPDEEKTRKYHEMFVKESKDAEKNYLSFLRGNGTLSNSVSSLRELLSEETNIDDQDYLKKYFMADFYKDSAEVKHRISRFLSAKTPQIVFETLLGMSSYLKSSMIKRNVLDKESGRLKDENSEIPLLKAVCLVNGMSNLLNTSLISSYIFFDIFNFLDERLAKKRDEYKTYTYDDLINLLAQSVEKGDTIVNALRKKYSAVFVDEFQDTDPKQWAILKKLYGENNTPLFLVGDPKQAIYSFRGADINSYFKAREYAKKKHGEEAIKALSDNYRSTKGVISAINTFSQELFKNEEKIEYKNVEAKNKDVCPLFKDGEEEKGMSFMAFYDCENIDDVKDAMLNFIRATISQMLSENSPYRLGEKKVKPSDIAVLVPTNDMGNAIRDRLSQNNIPCYMMNDESVFSGAEAKDILIFLQACVLGRDNSFIKRLGASSLFGYTYEEIIKDSSIIENIREHIIDWATEIDRGNIFSVIKKILTDTGLHKDGKNYYERTLSLFGGERIVSNMEQIIETLSVENSLGTNSVDMLSYTESLIKNATEENAIRLDRDSDAVSIVTTFKSKGLEFPIVFLADVKGQNTKTSYDYSGEYGRYYDIFQDEKTKEKRKDENAQAYLKTTYVAITRAKSKVYVPYAKPISNKSRVVFVKEILSKLDIKDDDSLKNFVKCNDAFGIASGKYENDEENNSQNDFSFDRKEDYRAKEANINIDYKKEEISSFTKIAKDLPHERFDIQKDHDDEEMQTKDGENKTDEKNAFSFKRGADAGTAFHSIMEEVVFTDFASDKYKASKEIVKKHIEVLYPSVAGEKNSECEEWADVVLNMVYKTLSSPMKTDEKEIYLNSIEEDSLLREVEFMLPVEEAKEIKLPEDEKSSFKIEGGYLVGYIDLVFKHEDKYYILDWKTNHLGDKEEDYNEESLERAIKSSHYNLQYYLYLSALVKILKSQSPNFSYEQIGGVFYAFVRGGENGFYFNRPSEKDFMKVAGEYLKGGVL